MSEVQKWCRAGLWMLSALPAVALARDGTVERKVPADARGVVEVSNTSGSIDVRGWDRNEVQVTGTFDDGVVRVEVESSSGRTLVKVIRSRGPNRGDADIEVRVPAGSSLEVAAVSADISSRGVQGTQRLKSVSGEVTADVAADESEIRSVSGDVTVRGSGKVSGLRVASVSGSLDVTGVGGRIELVTVSGDARIQAADASELRARTTSGSLELLGRMARASRVDVEAVSGDIQLRLTAPGGLDADVESFSGDIHGCLAKGVERASKYGPGVRLSLRAGDAGTRLRAKTLSGDVDICDR